MSIYVAANFELSIKNLKRNWSELACDARLKRELHKTGFFRMDRQNLDPKNMLHLCDVKDKE